MESGARKKLLIVDDDPRIRGLLADALGAVGYDTVQAGDAQEALDVVRNQRLDCVVADIKMPEVDGLTLLGWIKNEDPLLPVVMITGLGYKQQREKAQSAGADGFLLKPFRLAKIEETIARILELKESGSSRRPIKSVLVVEDDDNFRGLLCEMIGAMGYAVSEMPDAESAMELLADNPPDAIISDYKLPGMSGEDLIREVKAKHADLPVILITGYAVSTTGKEFADGAADAFLMKPFRMDKIVDLLRAFEA